MAIRLVVDKGTRPAGRIPSSTSESHFDPSVPGGRIAFSESANVAIVVFRQNRIRPSAAGTSIDALISKAFTLKSKPVSEFSGRPPSPGGLNLGSRQVPVHVSGSTGFGIPLLKVSL